MRFRVKAVGGTRCPAVWRQFGILLACSGHLLQSSERTMCRRMSLTLGLLSALACGGKVSESSTPIYDAGPVHDGIGSYYASVTAASDSCNPPLFVGSVGSQIVIVKSDSKGLGFNIPLCSPGAAVSPPYNNCTRSNFSNNSPWDVVLTPYLGTGKCDAYEAIRGQVLSFDGQEIDVEYVTTYIGFANCSETTPYPTSDCTSDRIFHYRWLKPDASAFDATSCS
jgi:hypothetical protein